MRNIELKYKTLRFKAADNAQTQIEQGIFAGYAAAFGNLDDGGDIIDPGAFTETIRDNFDRIKVLALHGDDATLPIGKPTTLREDDVGLYIEGRISDTTLGRDLKTLIRDGVINEMSIGYDPVDFVIDGATGIRHLKKVDLWEISLVAWAMNPEATVTDYKARSGKAAFDVNALPYTEARKLYKALGVRLARDTKQAVRSMTAAAQNTFGRK